MTDNIINLDDHRPHATPEPLAIAYVACLACAKDWVAVAPADTELFHCPDCDKMLGVVVDPTNPEFLNVFMSPSGKAARHKRTMVILNAQRMIDEGAFQ